MRANGSLSGLPITDTLRPELARGRVRGRLALARERLELDR
jgi:hypothetical protein